MAALDDLALAEAVAARVDAGLRVEARGGTVTLRGELGDWSRVVAAGHAAAAVPGVREVVNAVACPGVVERAAAAAAPGLRGTYDVVVIGGGVIGCAIAHELGRHRARVALLEREQDLATGQTGANNGVVHPGIDPPPGTLKARLNVEGNAAFPGYCAALGVPFRRTGVLGVVTDPGEEILLALARLRAEANGVAAEAIPAGDALWKIEPSLARDVVGALYAPSAGVTCPFRLTLALARSAARMGVDFHLDTEVVGFLARRGRLQGVRTGRGDFRCRWAVNCAGIDSDRVAAMAGRPEFTIHPRKGELVLFDRDGPRVGPTVGALTLSGDPRSKGGGLTLTVDGNLIAGPTAREIPDRRDTSVSAGGVAAVLAKFTRLVPALAGATPIAAFAGLRAATYGEDFIIAPSASLEGLLNVAGIQSPGLASAPAIAAHAVRRLRDMGFAAPPGEDRGPARLQPLFRDMSPEEQERAAAADPGHRRVVCRCETVTGADVQAALRGPVPARTLDGVKRRTRAGMGRCQGAFCGPRVAALIAGETGRPLWQVEKAGPGSRLYAGPTREGGG